MRKLKMRNKKFVEVFERYQKLVMKLVYDKSSDMELAKEICQHTFFNYYLHMDKVKDELIKPWLIMTAKNAIVDNYRKITSRKECPLIHVENIALDYSVERCPERLVGKELSFRILEDLHKANETWYEVIVAICIEELSHEEATKQLGCTDQVLRARLYRARKYIRKKYGKEYRDLF